MKFASNDNSKCPAFNCAFQRVYRTKVLARNAECLCRCALVATKNCPLSRLNCCPHWPLGIAQAFGRIPTNLTDRRRIHFVPGMPRKACVREFRTNLHILNVKKCSKGDRESPDRLSLRVHTMQAIGDSQIESQAAFQFAP